MEEPAGMCSPVRAQPCQQPLPLGLPQGAAGALQSVHASSLSTSIHLKYLSDIVSDEDSNFHLTYNYDDIEKH